MSKDKLTGRELKEYANGKRMAAEKAYLAKELTRIDGGENRADVLAVVTEDAEGIPTVEEYFKTTETEERAIEQLLIEHDGDLTQITSDMIDKKVQEMIRSQTESVLDFQKREAAIEADIIGRGAVAQVYTPVVNRQQGRANFGFRYDQGRPAGLPTLGKRR